MVPEERPQYRAAAAMDCRREISTAWRTLNESKTALRHIENRLEAVSGTGVVLDSLMNTEKTSGRSSRKANHRDRRGLGDVTVSRLRQRSRQSPDKTSYSPVCSSVHEGGSSWCGDRTHTHASQGDVAPPPTAAPTGAEVADPECALSQLVYNRDLRPLHGAELDSTRSSALDATTVHYLNNSPHLEMPRAAQQDTPGSEVRPVAPPVDDQTGAAHSSTASSPGSARLEKLRQRQTDGKLEKLRERIRRQREQLEETAERRMLEQPAGLGAAHGLCIPLPTATVRKVAPAPPAPIYKGFNTSEIKIRTSDGKVWGEEEFQNLSRHINRDLTQHLTEPVTQRPPERVRQREKKVSVPVRKIHRRASVPSSDAKPVISTSSWREGQKLVKMMLGSAPRIPNKPRAQSTERDGRTGSDPQLETVCHSRVRSTERPGLHRMPVATERSRPAGGGKVRVPATTEPSRRNDKGDRGPVMEQSSQPVTTVEGRRTVAVHTSRPAGGDEGKGAVAERRTAPAGADKCRSPSRGLLSADIRGILDDLQLEGGAEGPDEGGVHRRSPARSSQAPPRLSRSASPAKTRPESRDQTVPRKRHYDTDTVRQYIARQQEDRKRKQAEQRRSQREEAQRRSQRLQELYRKQREGVAKAPAPIPNSVQTHLQETYTKLLFEHTLQQPRPVYQPSGESDKENKGQDPLSPSPSDLSVSELRPPPLLSRAALGLESLYSSWLHAEPQSPAPLPSKGGVLPPGGQSEGAGAVEEASHRWAPSAVGTVAAALSEPGGDLHATLLVSRMERVEALKARAASLSSRVESEARKLASVTPNLGTGLPVSEDVLWTKPLSPPERERPGVVAQSRLNIQRLLRAGQSAFGGDSGELPGVGNLSTYSTQDQKENVGKPHPAPTGPSLPPAEWAEPPESSGGSISEGPLTDSSVSEGEDTPGDPTNIQTDRAKLSVREATVDYCAAQHNSHAHNPITAFQKEAEQLTPYKPMTALQDSRPPWEELTKGSTHSVISIFTKNLQNYSKVVEVNEGVTPLHAGSSVVGAAYEDDFISSHSSSRSASKRTSHSLSNGHSGGTDERRESCSLSVTHSSTTSPLSSPLSTRSTRTERNLERTLVEGQMNTTVIPDLQWNGQRKKDSENSLAGGLHRDADTDGTIGGASVHSVHRGPSEGHPFHRNPAASPASTVDFTRVSPPSSSAYSTPTCSTSYSPLGAKDPGPTPIPAPGPAPGNAPATLPTPGHASNTMPAPRHAPITLPAPGSGSPMQFTPGVLQQRMSAELNYLSAVEESVRQLGDVERVRAVCLAQQESVSLAQILKAQQHRQERDLQLMKMKTEEEALEAQRQMTKLVRDQLLNLPSITPLYDAHTEPCPQTDSVCMCLSGSSSQDVSPGSVQSQRAETPLEVLSESVTSSRPPISEGDSKSARQSPSPSVKEEGGAAGSGDCRGRSNSSVEEEVHTAVDDSLHTDSIQSLLEDRADSASVATEYSVRFEESVTEDELEKSFRSLLPSESHWRDSVERGRSSLPESDEEHNRDKSSSQLSTKDGSVPFSGGQDSFSKFTMVMVRQYMQEEEVRAQHQRSLLRLRHRALRDKTKAELAWLEHQKRRLRDKGEDDKMPPLRKRQRGLLLRLQQEQAEIRRLQEVSRAARRDRQLLLKQQEEIEKIQNTTLKLRQKLRSAGDTSPRSPVSCEVETRSPSPVSVSGSETSSILQKLKKMTCHTDQRYCSPVHCLFSVLSAQHWASLRVCLPTLHPKIQHFIHSQLVRFLTKREQQLVRRRLQAEELLAWRQRLDVEEAAVQRMELQALAAWEPHSTPSTRMDTTTHTAGSEEPSPVQSVSSVNTGQWEISSDDPASRRSPAHTHSPQEPESTQSNWANCTVSSSSKLPVQSRSRISEPHSSAPASEVPSDQSDIEGRVLSDVEGRVLALKVELRRRKAEVQQLKKEQKQRQKERLKAQEASLLKQLESYNNFIQKTKAELSKADNTPSAKPQIKSPAPSRDKPRIKGPGLCRPEANRNLGVVSELERSQKLTESPAESAVQIPAVCTEDVLSSEEEPSTVTPTPVLGSPERVSRSLLSPEPQHHPPTHNARSQLESSSRSPANATVSSERSEVIEELDSLKSEGLSDEQDFSRSAQFLEPLRRVVLQPAHRAEHVASPEHVTTPKMHALTGTCWPNAVDSMNGGEERNSSALLLNTDEPRVPDCPSLSDGPDLSPRNDGDEHAETPLPSTHGYNDDDDDDDDFESSLGSSPREGHQGSELTSPSAAQPKEKPSFVSSEEEIDEDINVGSETASGRSHSQSLLEVEGLPKPSKADDISDSAIPPKFLTTFPSVEGSLEPVKEGLPGYCVGDRVMVSNIHPGTLRFKGQTSFASGFWAGVELDKAEGTSNGVCEGVAYFQCRDGCGIFVPPDKISHLPEALEGHADTEDEDSSFDDQSDKMLEKQNLAGDAQQSGLQNEKHNLCFDSSDWPSDLNTQLPQSGNDNFITSTLGIDAFNGNIIEDRDKLTGPNGTNKDIVLKFESFSKGQEDLPIEQEKETSKVQRQEAEQTMDILDLLVSSEGSRAEDLQKTSGLSCVEPRAASGGRALGTLVDEILDRFMCDTLRQFQQIRKVKEEKITAANQQEVVSGEEALEGHKVSRLRSAPTKADSLHAFFDKDQEEVSSPELCNRSESPVLGPSGQEELAKRLAELELSRELLDVLGDEQDWFDEDFGLSSRREQQKLKQEGAVPASPQARTPARPQLSQVKQPEESAMLVPHTTPEVQKLVSTALQEIWRGCGLGQGHRSVAGVPKPQPSEAFLCDSNNRDHQEAQCLLSYKQAVFDLSWEVVQDVYMEDQSGEHPQWVRPRRVNSVCIHRVNSPSDITKVQAFVTSEVLKICGLKAGQSQKSDWQKMLKFGRKKRDRVDHILVQELHEDEAQWVNYDEDELFVKMQLADSIFDALLKDTAEVLIHIQEKRSKRAMC
ncbi:centrosome-associated protein 350 isoform X2 [Electrophorus electricus]|uniref:centrosome-associated protein 350 isoform X2 n=1 Tax=Electrophorus electricus TaxID=8005 RepID=UPI0015D0D0D8|nr:centrosome-associated protein 350 isoform X2 [Electrophorus electricus]